MQSYNTQPYGAQPRPGAPPNGPAQAYSNYAAQQQHVARQPQAARPAAAPQVVQPPPADRRRTNSVALGDGDAQYRVAKKRKATDRTLPTFQSSSGSAITLPPAVEAKNATLASLSTSYNELQRIERKLDWTITRKQLEVRELVGPAGLGSQRQNHVRRKLRVRVSNTCSNQPWQGGKEGEQADSAAASESGPGWTLQVEGALVEPEGSQPAANAPRFSSLVNKLVIDVEKSEKDGSEGAHAEFERKPDSPPQDGYTLSGKGTADCTARISLHLQHQPERLQLAQEFGGPLGITEGSAADILTAIWIYIRKNGLVDADDRKVIRMDSWLKKLHPHLSNPEKMSIGELPALMTRYSGRVPPIKLDYVIKLGEDPASSAKEWDLEIEVDDPVRQEALRSLTSLSQQSNALREQTGKLDDTIATSAARVRSVKSKRDALAAFSVDPVTYLRAWLSSQSTDIDQLLSGSDRSAQSLSGVTAEELRHSDFYAAPWLTDAINLHQGRLFSQKVTAAVTGQPARR